jgi:hypothetical protein
LNKKSSQLCHVLDDDKLVIYIPKGINYEVPVELKRKFREEVYKTHPEFVVKGNGELVTPYRIRLSINLETIFIAEIGTAPLSQPDILPSQETSKDIDGNKFNLIS